VTARKMLATHPERILMHAVKGMLPKNRIGRAMLKKLRVCVGPEHPYEAQKPEPYPVTRESNRQ
jgi:large subunit ribosomal protein L13